MIFQTRFHRILRRSLPALGMLLVPVGTAIAEPAEPKGTPPFRQWGAETMEVLHKDLWLPEKKL